MRCTNIADRRTKLIEIWDSGTLVTHIWATFHWSLSFSGHLVHVFQNWYHGAFHTYRCHQADRQNNWSSGLWISCFSLIFEYSVWGIILRYKQLNAVTTNWGQPRGQYLERSHTDFENIHFWILKNKFWSMKFPFLSYRLWHYTL